MAETGGAALRAAMADGPVLLPGCYDGISAAVLERAGFRALALSGAGLSASLLGLPDLGLLTQTELVDAARRIIARAGVPVLVDADTGFGNPLNVVRTVRELAAAGAAAVQIEDQQFPKRCGHLDGVSVVPAGEFVQKIRAAAQARDGADLLLVARTDALAVEGVDAAVDRANAALDAGADVAFVEAPRTLAEVEKIATQVHGPLLYNLATGGRSPALPVAELGRLGFALVVMPAIALFAALRGIDDAARAVLAAGDDTPSAALGLTVGDLYRTVGIEAWLELDTQFASN